MDTNKSTPTPPELPSDTRLLALAASAESQLQDKTGDAQFAAFHELTPDELMAWVILHT